MKINLAEKKSNPLLKRDEMEASIDYEGAATPSIASVRTEVAKAINVPEDRIQVVKLISSTGVSRGKVWLNVWESVDLIPKPKVKKKEEKK